MNEENALENSEGVEDPQSDPSVVVLDNDQYTDITNELQGINDSLGLIRSDLATIKNNQSSMMVETGSAPEDYYQYMADTQGQQIFFQSLMCGLLLAFAFFYGLKDKAT